MVRFSIPLVATVVVAFLFLAPLASAADYQVTETDDAILISTPQLEARIAKRGYVSGVARQSMLDKATGFRDPGFGLDIVDWIMEPGADVTETDDRQPGHIVYQHNNMYHGARAKRMIEGPQICTKAGRLTPEVIRGDDFVAIRQQYTYHIAAPGKKAGSTWTQVLVFPMGKRYFISMDRIDSVNGSPAMFLRVDMPGHLKHDRGDTFSQIYLSYHGLIPPSEFLQNFAPDAKFNYRRDRDGVAERMIRAYRLRDPQSGRQGPWLAGMTLDPSVVSEAWCHQRGYICFIEEFGERPIRPGESFSAAFIVGFFDSVDEMREVFDQHRGHCGVEVSEEGWKLVK